MYEQGRCARAGRREALVTLGLAMAATALTACTGTAAGLRGRDGDGRPAWITEPGDGVSASAGEHIRGRVAQEELAIARARDEFARRHGVRVSNEMSSELRVSGHTAVSSGQSTSTQSVSNTEVRASVRAKWLDPASGLLWVWLVPTK